MIITREFPDQLLQDIIRWSSLHRAAGERGIIVLCTFRKSPWQTPARADGLPS
jgi:hypothetical protein